MRPDLRQWFFVIFVTGIGIGAGGWWFLAGPAMLLFTLARNRWDPAQQSDGGDRG